MPVRLDPWQEVVNVSWGAAQDWLQLFVNFHWRGDTNYYSCSPQDGSAIETRIGFSSYAILSPLLNYQDNGGVVEASHYDGTGFTGIELDSIIVGGMPTPTSQPASGIYDLFLDNKVGGETDTNTFDRIDLSAGPTPPTGWPEFNKSLASQTWRFFSIDFESGSLCRPFTGPAGGLWVYRTFKTNTGDGVTNHSTKVQEVLDFTGLTVQWNSRTYTAYSCKNGSEDQSAGASGIYIYCERTS